MTAWARLTWQAADPAALAADLEHRLGVGAVVHTGLAGSWVVRLRGGDLELVPWQREAADDAPYAAGRLIFEPVDILADNPAADDAGADDPAAAEVREPGPAVVPLAAPAFRLAGVGWATVDMDRAETELGPWLEPADGRPVGRRADSPEPHLGGRTRVHRSRGLPGDTLVLAEPAREGRLAASLARDGEGPCALYLESDAGLEAWLAAAAVRGVAVSTVREGPLGSSVLLPGAPSGPHLVVVDGRVHSSPGASGGTIGP